MSKKLKSPSYYELSKKLNDALEWFESEQLDIDLAPKKYQEVQQLIAQMEVYLKEAKNKITKISS